MKETDFIKQNEKKWSEMEHFIKAGESDPDKLNDLFIQITDDLSYSRTFYKNRSVRIYLNGIARSIFAKIKKVEDSNGGHFIKFWTTELPLLMHDTRKAFRISFAVFALSVLIGVVSSMMDSDFPEIILGNDYVEMTKENIASGDPMRVYKAKGAFGMSMGITLNNLQVSLLIFVFGAFFSIGSIALIIKNGIMVGAFQYFFIRQGVVLDSLLTIWVHGTLEMSAMVIAGAAGITMGQGLLFPGSYSRIKAFSISARRGIRIISGIVPIVILAGFIEGFLTRQTEMPYGIRAVFIFLCLFFVLGYFVIYPWWLSKNIGVLDIEKDAVSPDNNEPFEFYKIKNTGALFNDTLLFIKRKFWPVVGVSAIAAVAYTVIAFLTSQSTPSATFMFLPNIFTLIDLHQFFNIKHHFLAPFLIGLGIWVLSIRLIDLVIKEEQRESSNAPVEYKKGLSFYINTAIGAIVSTALFIPEMSISIILWVIFAPYILLATFIAVKEKSNFFTGMGKAFTQMQGSIGNNLGLMLLLLLTGVLLYLLGNSGLSFFFYELLSWVLNFEQSVMDDISAVVLTFWNTFLIFLNLAMFWVSFSFGYYSYKEKAEAPALMAAIENIELKHRIKDLEKE